MVQIQNFDASQVDPSAPREVLPDGWYAMQIVASEIKSAKSGNGDYLNLEFEMLEVQHPKLKGRKIWVCLNLWNRNVDTSDRAQRDLSAICRATGELVIQDTDLLHFKPLALKLIEEEAKGGYEAGNKVTGYDALEARFPGGAAPAQQAPVANVAPTGAAPGTQTAPWLKKQ